MTMPIGVKFGANVAQWGRPLRLFSNSGKSLGTEVDRLSYTSDPTYKNDETNDTLLPPIRSAHAVAHAADVSDPWHAEFESPRGKQMVQFEFKTAGGKVVGKAISRFGGQERETEIQEGKIEREILSFV